MGCCKPVENGRRKIPAGDEGDENCEAHRSEEPLPQLVQMVEQGHAREIFRLLRRVRPEAPDWRRSRVALLLGDRGSSTAASMVFFTKSVPAFLMSRRSFLDRSDVLRRDLVLDRPLELVGRAAKLTQCATDGTAELGHLSRSEQKQTDDEDHDDLGHPEGTEHHVTSGHSIASHRPIGIDRERFWSPACFLYR